MDCHMKNNYGCNYLDEVGSAYCDVDIHFESGGVLKAHKLVLATKSSWFHKRLCTRNQVYHDIGFFNVSEKIVRTAVDLIYGKEVVFPVKEKGKLTWFLSKLGVSWQYCTNVSQDRDRQEVTDSETKTPAHSESVLRTDIPAPAIPLGPTTTNRAEESAGDVVKTQSDYYALLDEFTETNDDEVAKISHLRLIDRGGKPEKYKCIKCNKKAKYFSEAESHHNEHILDEFASVRETLKKAELDRQEDVKTLRKIEKSVGNADKKKLVRLLNRTTDKMKKNFEILDQLKDTYMPDKYLLKCKEFSKNLTVSINKAEKLMLVFQDK